MLAHPKIQRPKPCLLMFMSLVALNSFHLLLSIQLTADLTGGKWWIHVSSYVTSLCKNFFLLHWNSCKQCSESLTHFRLTVSKHSTHFEHSFLIDKCSYKIVNTLPSTPLLSHATSIYDWPKQVCGVFWCFLGQLPNLEDLSIQHHLCLYNRVKNQPIPS